jgi:hypothetical protein
MQTEGQCNLITCAERLNTFINMLLDKMDSLKRQHYIPKQQEEFLSKSKLQTGKCIITLDFPKNYAFVVQGAIQEYY